MVARRRRPRKGRVRVLDILDGRDPVVGRKVAYAINFLIVLAAVSYAASTMPGNPPAVETALVAIDVLVSAVFCIEYFLRLYAAPRRLGYALSFWGIIDLLAWAPAVFLSLDVATTVRLVRLVLVLRLLKLLRYSRALLRIARAFRAARDELTVFAVVALFTLYLAAVGIYHFEHDAQPDVFSSVPTSFWWAVVTLTTVGYGDIVPITVGGRIFASVAILVGMAIFAVPAGILASALISGEIEEITGEIEEISGEIEELREEIEEDASESQQEKGKET